MVSYAAIYLLNDLAIEMARKRGKGNVGNGERESLCNTELRSNRCCQISMSHSTSDCALCSRLICGGYGTRSNVHKKDSIGCNIEIAFYDLKLARR